MNLPEEKDQEMEFPDEVFLVEDDPVMQLVGYELLSAMGLKNISIAEHLDSFKCLFKVFLESKKRTAVVLLDSGFPESETVTKGSDTMWGKAISHVRDSMQGVFDKRIAVINYTAFGIEHIRIVENEIHKLKMPNFFVLPSQGKSTSPGDLEALISSLRQRPGYYR